MELHESIRAARQKYKMKGVQVADKLGLTSAAYLRYERGEVVPSANTIMNLADLYGCTTDAVMRTGGVDGPDKSLQGLGKVNFDLRTGEIVRIEISSHSLNSVVENNKSEPYRPAHAEPNSNGDQDDEQTA
jgi:transcriptional regulator with XRE-family HTH domain